MTATPRAAIQPAAAQPTSEVEAAPQVAPMENGRVRRIAIGFAVVLIALFLLGILPRLKLQRQLASRARSAAAALPIIAVTKAQQPSTKTTPASRDHESLPRRVYARSGYVRRCTRSRKPGEGVRLGRHRVNLAAQSVLQARAPARADARALALARSNLERWVSFSLISALTAQDYQQMPQGTRLVSRSSAPARQPRVLIQCQYTQVIAPFGARDGAERETARLSRRPADRPIRYRGGSQFARRECQRAACTGSRKPTPCACISQFRSPTSPRSGRACRPTW